MNLSLDKIWTKLLLLLGALKMNPVKNEIKDGKINIYYNNQFIDNISLKDAETIFFNANGIFTIFPDDRQIESETNPSVKQWFLKYKTKHINNLVSDKIKSIPDFKNVVLNCILKSFHNSKYSRFSHLMSFIDNNSIGLNTQELVGLFIIVDSMMNRYSGVESICIENTSLNEPSVHEYDNWSYHVIPICINANVSRYVKISFKVKLNMNK